MTITITLDYLRERVDEVGECWIWRLSLTKGGYPIMGVKRQGMHKTLLVRRVAAELGGRKPAPRQPVVSTCGDPLCVNPAHMRLSTPKAVAAKAVKNGSYRRLPRRVKIAASRRKQSRLTMQDARAIRATCERPGEVALRYGISTSTVRAIRAGRTWQDYGNPFAGLGARGGR